MALINVGASLPPYVWAVARFLLSVGGQYPADGARELLCPATLQPDDTATFNDAIGTLTDLGLVTADGGKLRLSPAVQGLSPDDLAGFGDRLRRAVLAEAQNAGLDGSGDQAADGCHGSNLVGAGRGGGRRDRRTANRPANPRRQLRLMAYTPV